MFATGLTLPAPLAGARSRTGSPRPMEEARFEAFYRANAGSLWSYLYRLTGDSAATDDLVQKTFFRFLRATPVVASVEHMRRWLFRAATNLALDHFREMKRERSREVEAPLAHAEERAVLRHDMMKIFAELEPRQRALLWLAHVEEVDHQDIADSLGVKTKSVKVLLFRARKKLGEILTRKGLAP